MVPKTPAERVFDDVELVPRGYELLRGELVDRPSGALAAWVTGQLICRLDRYCDDRDSGWVLGSGAGYRCFPGQPNTVRRPSISFLRRERLLGQSLINGDTLIPPDLVAEFVFPDVTVAFLDEKVDDWLYACVRLVWVVNPQTRTVMVYRADGTVVRLRDSADLSGEDVLPGFSVRVAAFLPPPASAS